MKISCQSCHSKYNVADDKVQGKIVKIRCRKCGETIVVNASGGAAAANGSAMAAPATAVSVATAPAAPAAMAAAAASVPAADGAEWHVSVADDDQRTMRLEQLVAAYNEGVVTQDTYVWADGMGDWKPLGEVEAVVSALHAAVGAAVVEPAPPGAAVDVAAMAAAPEAAAASLPYDATMEAPVGDQAPRAAAHGAGLGLGAVAVPAAEAKRAAVKREARSRDLFATRTGEELRTGLDPSPDDGKLTGQRNENSVLFSLEHLTKNAEERVERDSSSSRDDSGMIDLKALAAKAESMRPAATPDAGPLSAPLGYGPYTSPLGTPLAPLGATAQPKSKVALLLGAGAGVALLLVLGIVIGLKLGGSAAPAVAATASAAPLAAPSAMAAVEPAASASPMTAPHASASAAPASPVAATTPPKSRTYWHAPAKGGAPAAGAAGGGGAPAPAPKKGSDCNCNGDLMCMMKCSTH